MIMADILMWFLLTIGILLVFISYWLATQALWSQQVIEYADRFQKHPITTLLIGVAVTAPVVISGIILLSVPFPMVQLIGLATLLFAILAGLVGSTGLCACIGTGLHSPADQLQPWRPILRGGIVLSLTFLFPVLGWFFIFPLVLTAGIGVGVRVALGRLFRASVPATSSPEGFAHTGA